MAGVVAVAALVAIARQSADAASTSDTAVIESFTLLASEGRLLLGPYSRFQWHHPGPLYFYLMAPFYVLAGEKTSGLHAGALVLNLVSVFALTRILSRRANATLAMAVTGSVGVYLWRSAEMLASPWNPHAPVVAMMTLVLATADVLAGAHATLPLVAVLASLAGQTHVALLPLSLALGAVAFGGSLLSRAEGAASGGGSRLKTLRTTVLVLLLCWTPTLLEQATNTPGNLTQIFNFFALESRPGQTFSNAVSAWGDMLSGVVRPDFYVAHGWRFEESPVKWAETFALAQLAGLIVFAALAARARRRFECVLAIVLFASAVLALWSASQIEGAIFDHEVFWIAGLGALNTALLIALVVELTRFRVVRRVRLQADRVSPAKAGHYSRAAASAVCLLIAIAAWRGTAQLRHVVAVSASPADESVIARAVAGDLEQYLEANRLQRPLIRIDQDTWGIAAGVILRLQKAGLELAVEDDWLPMFTPVFKRRGNDSAVLTVAGKAEHVRMTGVAGDSVVIARDPIYVHRSSSPPVPPAAP